MSSVSQAFRCCDMSMPPPEERTRLGEVVCLFQFRGAVLAAHLDRFAADLDLDWVVAEFAIASSAGPLCHDARLHEHPTLFGEHHGAIGAAVRFFSDFEHDPEKWTPVFGKDHAPRTS